MNQTGPGAFMVDFPGSYHRRGAAINFADGHSQIKKWLEPSTDHSIISLARMGKKDIAVICPSFVADCLETLEEIGEEGRSAFLGTSRL